ncbi:MAG: BMP family ABC transporter substrate-binding protein [Clostridia bacterium]|nr:BMP family ABC transporter substrate-binding protein [Clostridia bacterium]
MKKLLTLLVTAILAVTCCLGLTACGEDDTPVVALITLHGESSTYDKNFIDAFKTACENKGLGKKQYAIVSNINEDISCYNTAKDLVDQGYKGIFADSFGHEAFMIQAAEEFKDVQFYHATGTSALARNLSNFHNAFASIYEGRYIAGYAAGLKLLTMTDKADSSNNFKLGYVGAHPYAEVISGYTSWYLGVQAALEENPVNEITYTATMDVTYTGTWYGETEEKSAAETLIQGGAVLVSQHADSMGAPTACDTARVPNVAYNGSTGKNTLVAYSKINWVPYFEKMIDQVKGGAAVETDWTGTIATESVQWEVGPAATTGAKAKLNEIQNELIAGTRKVFDTSKFEVNTTNLDAIVASQFNAVSDYDVDGTTLTSFTVAGVDVIKTAGSITYFDESTVMSAPYFEIIIEGITVLS